MDTFNIYLSLNLIHKDLCFRQIEQFSVPNWWLKFHIILLDTKCILHTQIYSITGVHLVQKSLLIVYKVCKHNFSLFCVVADFL